MTNALGAQIFPPEPKARADMRPGTIYAVAGPDGSVFYGQVCSDNTMAFIARRDSSLAQSDVILTEPIGPRLLVNMPSMGRALRNGRCKKLGKAEIRAEFVEPMHIVQWPVGTLTVSVWRGDQVLFDTRVEDPAIQQYELMAIYDAEYHLPLRLLVDIAPDEAVKFEASRWVGGPISRERRLKELTAQRHPHLAHHRLPADWVWTRQN